jgi:hypothetical protein
MASWMLLPTRWRRTRVGKEEEVAVSSAEENKALTRRFMEAHVKGDLDAVDEMMAPTSSATLNCFPAKSPAAKA